MCRSHFSESQKRRHVATSSESTVTATAAAVAASIIDDLIPGSLECSNGNVGGRRRGDVDFLPMPSLSPTVQGDGGDKESAIDVSGTLAVAYAETKTGQVDVVSVYGTATAVGAKAAARQNDGREGSGRNEGPTKRRRGGKPSKVLAPTGDHEDEGIAERNAATNATNVKARRIETDRIAEEKAEMERLAEEEAEQVRLAEEIAELAAKQEAARERLATEKAERERAAKEEAEKERVVKETAERERKRRVEVEKEKAKKDKNLLPKAGFLSSPEQWSQRAARQQAIDTEDGLSASADAATVALICHQCSQEFRTKTGLSYHVEHKVCERRKTKQEEKPVASTRAGKASSASTDVPTGIDQDRLEIDPTPRYRSNGGRRLCCIKDCTKNSCVKSSDEMCSKHYRAWIAANTSDSKDDEGGDDDVDDDHDDDEGTDEGAASETADKELAAKEKEERGRIAMEEAERERSAEEDAEKERLATEKAERERAAKEEAEKERVVKETAEREHKRRVEVEKEKAKKDKNLLPKAGFLSSPEQWSQRAARQQAIDTEDGLSASADAATVALICHHCSKVFRGKNGLSCHVEHKVCQRRAKETSERERTAEGKTKRKRVALTDGKNDSQTSDVEDRSESINNEGILTRIPLDVKSRFREVGFASWGKVVYPVIELGPYDVSPGKLRDQWFAMFENVSIYCRSADIYP